MAIEIPPQEIHLRVEDPFYRIEGHGYSVVTKDRWLATPKFGGEVTFRGHDAKPTN